MPRTNRWTATTLILLSAVAPSPVALPDSPREWIAGLLTPGDTEAGNPSRPEEPAEKEGGMMDPNGEPPNGNTGATEPDPHG